MGKVLGEENLTVFPFNYESSVLCEFKEDITFANIHSIISYQENNIDKVKNVNGILITEDARKAISYSDGIVICDNVQKLGKKAFLNRMREVRNLKKAVYISSYMYDWLGKESFENSEVYIVNRNPYEELDTSPTMFDINCPIISILGMGENCDKFLLLLSIKKYLKEKGYNVLAISGNSLGKLLGCETLPDFMYRKDLSLVEKTIKINQYIYRLVEDMNPDIILLGHAGGIMKLNEFENNYFGEISYILSNAVVSDYGILCHYFNPSYTEKYFEEITKLCKMRLGIDILRSYVSKQGYRTELEYKKINYNFYNNEFCDKFLNSELTKNKEVLFADDDKGLRNTVNEIIQLLGNNPEII